MPSLNRAFAGTACVVAHWNWRHARPGCLERRPSGSRGLDGRRGRIRPRAYEMTPSRALARLLRLEDPVAVARRRGSACSDRGPRGRATQAPTRWNCRRNSARRRRSRSSTTKVNRAPGRRRRQLARAPVGSPMRGRRLEWYQLLSPATDCTKDQPFGVPRPVAGSQPNPVGSVLSSPNVITNQRVEYGLW